MASHELVHGQAHGFGRSSVSPHNCHVGVLVGNELRHTVEDGRLLLLGGPQRFLSLLEWCNVDGKVQHQGGTVIVGERVLAHLVYSTLGGICPFPDLGLAAVKDPERRTLVTGFRSPVQDSIAGSSLGITVHGAKRAVGESNGVVWGLEVDDRGEGIENPEELPPLRPERRLR